MCYLCDLLRYLFERMDKYPLQLPFGTFIFFFVFFFLLFTHLIFCVFKNKTVQWPENQESRRSSVQSPLTEGSSRDGVRGWRNGRTETGEGGSFYEIHPHHHHHPPPPPPPATFLLLLRPLSLGCFFPLFTDAEHKKKKDTLNNYSKDAGWTDGRTDGLADLSDF